MRRVALYMRVSGSSQNLGNQKSDLTNYVRDKGWKIWDVYAEKRPGYVGRGERPEYDRLLIDASRHRFDGVVAWSVDRIGRDFDLLNDFRKELQSYGVDIYTCKDGVDTSTMVGVKNYWQFSIYSHHERDMQCARTRAGKAGVIAVKNKSVELARSLKNQGVPVDEIADVFNCSQRTIYRYLRAA